MTRQTDVEASRLTTLITLSVAIAIVPYDYIAITLAMPRLRDALGFSAQVLPWILGGYVLIFGSCLVLAGRLGDFYGRRRMILSGLIIFGVCSAITALANDPELFLAARLCKGIGSALLSANALASVNVLFPEGAQRNRSYGISSFVMGAFLLIYMTGAGALLTHSWRYLLLINVPLTLVLFGLVLRVVPETIGRGAGDRFDFLGALLSVGAFGCLSLAVSNSFRLGIAAPVTGIYFLATIVFFAGLVRVEGRHPAPILPLHLLKLRNVVGAYLVCFFWSAGNTSYPLPAFLQEVLRYTPQQASMAILPTTLIGSVGALLIARLLKAISLRTLLIGALLLEAVGILGYVSLTPASSYLVHLLPAALATSSGFLVTWIAVRLTAVSGVRAEDQGVASGSIFAMQQLGNSVGIPGLAAIMNTTLLSHAGLGPDAKLLAYRVVFSACIALLAIALVPAIFVISGRRSVAVAEFPVTASQKVT